MAALFNVVMGQELSVRRVVVAAVVRRRYYNKNNFLPGSDAV
jgi:hypothetical protein